jgi:hypothetical protein
LAEARSERQKRCLPPFTPYILDLVTFHPGTQGTRFQSADDRAMRLRPRSWAIPRRNRINLQEDCVRRRILERVRCGLSGQALGRTRDESGGPEGRYLPESFQRASFLRTFDFGWRGSYICRKVLCLPALKDLWWDNRTICTFSA